MTKCPNHDVDLQPVEDAQWRGKLLVCPVKGCTVNEMVTKALKLPGLDPGRQYKTIRATEAELVRQWIQWGGLHNCTILQIGQDVHYLSCPSCKGRIRKILCPSCHETNSYSIFSQNTTGAPDTFWTHPSFGHNVWKGLEAKRDEKAPVREEQARLAALGYVDVVWTLEMVKEALRRR